MKTKASVAAFSPVEDLDCRPIYLGVDRKDSSYWFYALKGNIARFLKYVNYFHWDRGPQEILELVPLPLEIETELSQFLKGQISYEFVKKRSNSREPTVHKSYRNPVECSEPPVRTVVDGLSNPGRDGDGRTPVGATPDPTESNAGTGRQSGNAIPLERETEPVNEQSQPDSPVGKRRVIRVTKVNEMKPVEPTGGLSDLLAPQEPLRRGPSKRKKEGIGSVAKVSRTPSDMVIESVNEQDHRVELAQLEVLSPPRRKPGRPKKTI